MCLELIPIRFVPDRQALNTDPDPKPDPTRSGPGYTTRVSRNLITTISLKFGEGNFWSFSELSPGQFCLCWLWVATPAFSSCCHSPQTLNIKNKTIQPSWVKYIVCRNGSFLFRNVGEWLCVIRIRLHWTRFESGRGLKRYVIYLGWPIAPSYLSDRLERKRECAGNAGLSLAVYRSANGAQLNFDEYI